MTSCYYLGVVCSGVARHAFLMRMRTNNTDLFAVQTVDKGSAQQIDNLVWLVLLKQRNTTGLTATSHCLDPI